jgi:hypothetical protein
MQTHEKWMVVVIAVAVAALVTMPRWLPADAWRTAKREQAPIEPAEPRRAPRPAPFPPHDPAKFARRITTAHYAIASNATAAQTQQAGASLEGLYAAWRAFVPAATPALPNGARLQVALYRDRADFKAHNASRAWAQGYYRRPVCHAYFDVEASNPTHWLLHEATHQLDGEVGRFANTPWVEEGLASYFGTSRVVDGRVFPGEVDPGAYPVRWLDRVRLSGDLDRDLARRRLIPLRELIDSDGPVAPYDVNPYYIGYWSLAHYLMHGDGGRHADAFRAMVAEGGSFAQFEQRVGRVETVQKAWYAHLREQVALHGAGARRR